MLRKTSTNICEDLGIDPARENRLIDVARGWTFLALAKDTAIPAMVCTQKWFHCGRNEVLNAAVLLAVQGFDPTQLNFTNSSYEKISRLAGNGICVPQLGAIALGVLAYALPTNDTGHFLSPPCPERSLGASHTEEADNSMDVDSDEFSLTRSLWATSSLRPGQAA